VTSPSDLPPWLRPPAARAGTRRRGRGGSIAALGLALFAAGGGLGYLLGLRRAPHPALPPQLTCPPAVACAEPPPAPPHAPAAVRTAPARPRHAQAAHPAPAALVPLPDGKPMDETQRTQALRAFATKRAPELRDCLDDPDQGPPVELGAAFEIKANGAVDLVQILGADTAPREVRHCYASRLKKWRFPEELLRGEEKLLVNFVL